jgi:signal transduction histidine kinase/CheY-like chemotaxis protein
MTTAYVLLVCGWGVAGVASVSAIVCLGIGGTIAAWGWSLLIPALLLAAGLSLAGIRLRRRRHRFLAEAGQQLADAEAAGRREADVAAAQERILTDVRGCSLVKSALTVLFRHLVPSPRDGFACLLEIRNDTARLRAARGLSLPTGREVPFDRGLLRRIGKKDFLRMTADELRATEFAAILSSDDRRKVRHVHVFRVGDSEAPAGLVITTRLFVVAGETAEPMPPNAARHVLRECGRHLLELIDRQESKVRAESQTALRELVQPSQPEGSLANTRPAGDMLLAGLRDVVAVDRVSAFTVGGNGGGQDEATPLFRSGVPAVPTIDRIWSRHEAALLELAEHGRFVHLSSKSLKDLGIDSIIGSAAVATFAISGSQRGALVLTSRGYWQPSARDERLIVGCCEFLGEDAGPSASATPQPLVEESSAATAVEEPTAAAEQESRPDPAVSVSAREEFLAVMSHELRTPVSTILGMTELALAGNLPAEQRQYLSLVQSSSESMLTMLNDVLDLAKLEAGGLQPERIAFHVHSTLGEALKSIAFKAHEKKLELCLGIARDVPDVLVGDPVRLRQVLVNLVANGIKFTRSGEVAVRVQTVSVAGGRCRLRFAVRDSGCGIPPEVQDRIFSKYAQADQTVSRNYGGTGLGLAISREIVEMMGGTIAVDSEPGKGSTFHFEAEFDAEDRERRAVTNCEIALPGSILVVEDHPVTRGDLAEAVESLRLSCRLATEVEEAARFLEDTAAVLLDADLPSAADLLRRIEKIPDERRPTVILLRPVVLGSNTVTDDHAAVRSSLFKPVHRDEIRDALQAVAGQSPSGNVQPEAPFRLPANIIGDGGSFRVLLAEDNAVNQFVTTQLLEQAGITVTIAADGREAVETALREPFDLVLMDMQMPELDGVAATEEIRRRETELGRRTPIVAMTARSRKSDREQCERAGMDGFLTKPLSAQQFSDCLHDLQSRGSLNSVGVNSDCKSAAGTEAVFDEVADLFRATCAESIDAIKRATTAADAAALENSAHSLKGAASCLGEDRLVELLAELEQIGAECRLEDAQPVVQQLDAEIARVLR